MNELSLVVQQGKVEVLHYAELKKEVDEKASHYKVLVLDETQLPEAKTDLASLRKLAKALNDERIAKEKEYMIPFNFAKSQIDELVKPVKEAIENIDSQLKAFEEAEAQKKTLDIVKLWEMKHFALLPYSKAYDPKWLNKGFDIKAISEAMDKFIEKVNSDFSLIERLCGVDNEEAITETWAIYKESITLDPMQAVDEQERRVNAKKKADEERQQAKLQKSLQEAKTIEIKPVEAPIVEEAPKEPLYTVNLSITGTLAQQKALKEFLLTTGMAFKKTL
jgi:hypothetical protein